jgi:hypothetical protein
MEGRGPDERRAAAEARARARAGQPAGDEAGRSSEATRAAADERPMSRHYGGGDVYGRRRLYAILGGVALVIVLFLLLVGC